MGLPSSPADPIEKEQKAVAAAVGSSKSGSGPAPQPQICTSRKRSAEEGKYPPRLGTYRTRYVLRLRPRQAGNARSARILLAWAGHWLRLLRQVGVRFLCQVGVVVRTSHTLLSILHGLSSLPSRLAVVL